MVTATIPIPSPSPNLGLGNIGVVVSPDGSKLYVTDVTADTGSVSVINTTTNMVTATIPVGLLPFGVAVTPDGSKVYVANEASNTAVIDTATNMVSATIPVGVGPLAFGVFIQPPPRFAGTPGNANCYGRSVSALVLQDGGLNAAVAALGFSGVPPLQNAILAFCGG
jgi:YVTN family beta-propeller protein